MAYDRAISEQAGSLRRGLSAMAIAAAPFMANVPAAAQQPESTPTRAPAAIAFTGTTVIDVRTGRLLPNQVIVVIGNRIHAVGAAGNVRLPAGTRVIRANGTYAIPGLWDMHVHSAYVGANVATITYPLFVANGVTGVRDMGSPSLDSLLRWRREVLAGTRVGPRSVVAGPLIDPAEIAHAVHANTPAEARHVVDSLKQAGADFIKFHDDASSREVFFAVAAEARRVGLPLAAHLPGSVTLAEASDSGLRSIEHFTSCNKGITAAQIDSFFKGILDLRDCPALAPRLIKNDTWFSIGNPMIANSPLLTGGPEKTRYWPDSILFPDTVSSVRQGDSLRYTWLTANGVGGSGRSVEVWAAVHENNDSLASASFPFLGTILPRHFYRKLQRAGVRLLAGTDVIPGAMPFAPGFSLHNLLWALVNDGLTPLEALQAATLNPAKFFHATDSLGTVAPGKLADFVLLDANPLQDIYNTRRVRAVVANGRFFDRGDLDKLLLNTEWSTRRSIRSRMP